VYWYGGVGWNVVSVCRGMVVQTQAESTRAVGQVPAKGPILSFFFYFSKREAFSLSPGQECCRRRPPRERVSGDLTCSGKKVC